MTYGEIQSRVLERVGEGATPVYYTAAKVLSAVNEAQRFFCLLTLCLEKAGTLPLTASTSFYHLQDTFSDFLVPLRVQIASTGARVRPCMLSDLRALNPAWQSVPGTPEKYVFQGFDFLGLYPRPAAVGTSLTVTYAHMPARMTSSSNTPEIPEACHNALVKYAVYRLRLQEGGQEFIKVLPLFKEFMQAAAKEAEYVRARRASADYDMQPFEVAKLLEASDGE